MRPRFPNNLSISKNELQELLAQAAREGAAIALSADSKEPVPDVLSVKQAAEYLGISETTIRRGLARFAATDGQSGIKHLNAGRSKRIEKSDLLAWAKKRKNTTE